MDLEKLLVKVMAETSDVQSKLKKVRDDVAKTANAGKGLTDLGKGAGKGLDIPLKKIRGMNDAIKTFARNAKIDAGLIKPTQGFINVTNAIFSAQDAVRGLEQQIENLDAADPKFDEKLEALNQEIIETTDYMEGLNDAQNEAVKRGEAFEDIGPPSFLKDVKAYASELARGIPVPASLKKYLELMRNIGRGTKNTGSGIKRFAEGVVNDLKKPIGWLGKLASGFGKVFSKIPLLGKAANSFNGIIKKILATVGVLALLKRAISMAKEGFTNLSAYDANTRSSIESLRASLEALKNALATAFAPILSVVAPILATLIDWCTAAATAIAHLMAALTGKSTVVIARKATSGVASGVSGIGSSADEASGSVDKLKRSLMGFDQINKLDDNSGSGGSGGSGGGGGGGAGGAGSMFDTVEVGAEATALADAIKEAWANADFTEIGETVAEKLNGALESIPWDKIKATSQKIAKSVATFLNGFFGNSELWYNVGKTFAEAINTVIEFGYTFVTTFDWRKFGTAIGNSINGFFQNLDLAKAAQGLSEAIKGIFGTISSALETVDWSEVGNKIAEFIINIDWIGIAKSILEALTNALIAGLEMIGSFVDALLMKLAELIEAGLKKLGINVDITGKLQKVDQSGLSTDQKTIKGAKASLTTASNNIPTSKRVVGAFKASLTSATNNIATNKRVVGGFKASLTDKIDNIPSYKKKLSGFKAIVSSFEGATSTINKALRLAGLATGGIYKNGKWQPVTAAAGGGTFNQGQLFVAREAGPEMVGTIGGHTAVMNNDQIVSSVPAGVYKAVRAAMPQNSGSGGVTIVLEGDTGKFFKAMQKEARNYTNATGLSAFPV